jgi:hypothetical protein
VIKHKNEWLISAVVLVLAGCGGGGGEGESSSPATAPAQQQPAQSAPTISGSPTTAVTAGQAYTFQPSASDANGDTLTFSITGAPSWASFNAATGQLSGSPSASHVGTTSNIVISVSDGGRSASLPAFSINVAAAPASGSNSAPTISGNPTTSLNVGMAYSFLPTAADADGDTLTFTITNAPSWASFNSQTGRLNGTPGAGDVGTTSNIRISVSDGTVSRQLAAFSITVSQISNGSVTLDWTPPTANADGSTLANLAGYRILYGTSPSALNQTVEISNPSVTSYVVQNLSAATWYFSIRSYNSQGVESVSTNAVSQQIL